MIKLTEKEKQAFKNVRESFVEEPLSGIDDGLIQSYYDADAYTEFKEVAYGLAKKLLIEVAKKRDLKININDSFEANEIINNEELKDFNPEYYEDYNVLRNYIKSATKEMSVTEIEEFHRRFTHIGGINDSIREFMTKYIPKITSNLYELSYEIEQEETKEDILEYPTDEDWKPKNDGLEEQKGEVISSDNPFDWIGDDDEWLKEYENKQEEKKEEKLSDEELSECIKFLNSYSKLMMYKSNGQKVVEELTELTKSKKLKDFYDNKEFMKEFEKIMTHDKEKHNYLFHGTQDLESAESILNQGLGMMREDLSATTYSEFSMDEVILYSRGFGGEVGRDAIVIIDQPINEEGIRENIVQNIDEKKEIDFSPSGLQGLDGKPNYIVDSKYIIGFVNKRDKQVTFNSKYYDFDRFMQDDKGRITISESDIGKITINVDTKDKDKAQSYIENNKSEISKEEK